MKMIEKRFCKDCKYTKGIGFDFWCGEGHTEYEVFMGETNCPYYKFHDWSKGTPNTIKNKRFMVDDAGTLIDMHTRDMFDIVEEVCPLLNILVDENEELKSKLGYEKREHTHWKKECLESINEIAQLKREIVHLNEDDLITQKRFEFRLCTDELYYFYIIDNETGKEYKYLIDDELLKLLNELHEENNQLKKEIVKFKEWEKHIGDVKREDLDKVFKMSIYEIAEAFKYYQKRIKELEE